jgi:hypothetical protein
MGLSHVTAREPTSQGGKAEGGATGLSHVAVREPTSRGHGPKGAATAYEPHGSTRAASDLGPCGSICLCGEVGLWSQRAHIDSIF